MRRPPIVGLVGAVSLLVIMLLCTYKVGNLDDPIELAAWLFIDLIIFGVLCRVILMDVQWLKIFSTPTFQGYMSALIIVVTATIVCGVVFSLEPSIFTGAIVLEIAIMVFIIRYVADRMQRGKIQATI
ncbi:hypothetical protein [Candidatus Methanomassiliicoccus intestinalis]|uniref:hypothetical protein n=1 Tax=Candidatus Methanomassiliicoccus intestinalis TaxID=1406512 RepID=UPI0037DC18E0